jgi:hypothetical protein
MSWMYMDVASTAFYPTGNMSSRDASHTTVAGESEAANAAYTRIKSIQIGSGTTVGTLTISNHAGTVMRTIAAPAASTSNMSVNQGFVEFDILGGFSASCTSATLNMYIQYEVVQKWSSA